MQISDRYEAGALARPASDISTRSRSRILFGITVCAFAIVSLGLGLKLNLYIDELYSLHTTSRGFAYALQQSLGFEQQPPLFFIVLTAWRLLSRSDAFARLLPVECAVVTLFVVRSFSRRRLKGLPDWVAPLAVAINPFFLWAALDVRVYALIILISAVLVSSFFDAFVSDAAGRIDVAWFTVVAVAALYTQYFLGALFVGFAAVLLLLGPRRKIVPFAGAMAVVVVASLPLLAAVRNQFQQATVVNAIPPLALAGRMLSATASFVYPHYGIGAVSKLLNLAYLAIVVISLVVLAAGLRTDRTVRRLFALAGCIGACFLFVIVVARAPLEMPRHISALFIPVVLLALASIAALPAALRGRVLAAYLTVLAVSSATNDAFSYRPPLSKEGDWQRVGSFLNTHVGRAEPIAVFDAEDVLAVRHYYNGASAVVALPREQSFAVFDRRDFAIAGDRQLAAVFPAAAPATGRAWLVVGVSVCPIVELGRSCATLDSYVNAHYKVLQQRVFDGTVVRELRAITPRTARTPLRARGSRRSA